MAKCPNSKAGGFTLVEILIAAGVLTALLAGAFGIFRSGSRSFNTGGWRTTEQKVAQGFLAELVKDLQQATPDIFRIASEGALIRDPGHALGTPISINDAIYSTDGSKNPRLVAPAFGSWKCVLVCSITRPFRERNATFSQPLDTPGEWTGISIWVKDREVKYIRSNTPTSWSLTPVNFPAAIIPPVPSPAAGFGGVTAGGAFRPSTDRIKTYTATENLEWLSIVGQGNPVRVLEIRARFRRWENNQPAVPETAFDEVVSAQLASGSRIALFTH